MSRIRQEQCFIETAVVSNVNLMFRAIHVKIDSKNSSNINNSSDNSKGSGRPDVSRGEDTEDLITAIIRIVIILISNNNNDKNNDNIIITKTTIIMIITITLMKMIIIIIIIII